jgi:serine protease
MTPADRRHQLDGAGPHFIAEPTGDLNHMRRAVLLIAALALAATAGPASAAAGPNDPRFAEQWGPQQVHAPQAWARSTGAGQVIAVVDSGVDLGHPDLAGQLVPGATFFGCATTGPCGDGDWESGGKAAGKPDPHGTHVAGIAAAATDNGIGIAGVAPGAKIMPIMALGEEGGTFAEIAAGIRWAAANDADVINLSLAAPPGAQSLEITGMETLARDAIDFANRRGAVVVIAAGNEFASLCGSPSFNNGALCVVATDRFELRASYSNFAVKPDLLTVAGPGGQGSVFCEEDILSTVPAGSEGVCGGGGYDAFAGTSMAAPHVAGVAALLTAQGRSNSAIYDLLKTTAHQPHSDLQGIYNPLYGYGIVDAAAAVAAPGATVSVAKATGATKGGRGGKTDPKR